MIKFEINGECGFLKVSLAFVELDTKSDARLPPSKQLLTQRVAKDSEIKRQLLLPISEDLPETLKNVKMN